MASTALSCDTSRSLRLMLSLLSHATREPFLDDLYDRHRGRCYEEVHPVLVRLIGDALIQHHGSGRKSLDHAAETSPCR